MAVRDYVSVQYFHDKARAAELLNVGLLSGITCSMRRGELAVCNNVYWWRGSSRCFPV